MLSSHKLLVDEVSRVWRERESALFVNLSNINNGEKDVRLIVKQGKSNLTLSYGYMKLFIAYWIVRDNVIA